MNTRIYRAQVLAPFGLFTIAVDSTEYDARVDLMTAAITEFSCSAGMVSIKNVSRSNRRIIANMHPITKAQSNGQTWAWINRT